MKILDFVKQSLMQFKCILVILSFLSLNNAYAQQDDKLTSFLDRYSTKSKMGIHDPNINQIGTVLPAFDFSKSLNSRVLKGKVIVFDFWATWCSGCLVVSQGLDSLMVKESDVYKDVQIIGVNTKEKMVDKGYNATEYWKKTNKGYPMVDGQNADAFSVAVKNGFPTIILVDDKGIIRQRWDGAGPSTAGDIRLAAWEYAVLPKLAGIKKTVDNAKILMDKKDWISALYFLEDIPEKFDSISVMKFDAMLHLSDSRAYDYVNHLIEKWKDCPSCESYASGVVDVIIDSGVKSENLLLSAIHLYDGLRRKPAYANNYSFWEKYAELNFRYANYQKETAIRRMQQAINMAQDKADEAITTTMKEKMEKFKNL